MSIWKKFFTERAVRILELEMTVTIPRGVKESLDVALMPWSS